MKTDLYIQLGETQTDTKTLMDMAKEIWKADGNAIKDLSSVKLFFKPEEGSCDYIINGEEKGHFFV